MRRTLVLYIEVLYAKYLDRHTQQLWVHGIRSSKAEIDAKYVGEMYRIRGSVGGTTVRSIDVNVRVRWYDARNMPWLVNYEWEYAYWRMKYRR